MKYYLLFIFVFCSGTSSHACLCELISFKEQYRNSKSIFIARVNEIKDTILFDLRNPQVPVHYSIVYISILKQYKGDLVQNNIRLFTNATGEGCGYSFEKGHDYLIYTYSGKYYPEETNKCTLTKDIQLSKAKELRKLKKLSRNSN